jgi:hypothetical protein
MKPRSFAILVSLLVAALDGTAHAQPAAAQENDPRVGAAQRACLAGDVTTGIHLLTELYAATNDARWLFNQGRCYEQNRQPGAAIERFRLFLREGGEADSQLRQQAAARIQALQPRPVEPPPGPLVLPTRAHQPEQASAGKGLRVASLVLGVLGVAAVTTGIVLSLRVNALAGEIERDGQGSALQDPRAASEPFTSGKRLSRLQWPAYLAGGALLAGATICFTLGTPRASEPPAPQLMVSARASGESTEAAVGLRF